MKKQGLPIVLILIIMFTVGCLRSLAATGQRQNENLSRALGRIKSTNDPVHGTALILLPSDAEILKHYLYYSLYLQPSDAEIQKSCISYETRDSSQVERVIKIGPKGFDQKNLNHHITVAKNNLLFVVEAIRKRGIFNSVAVAYQKGNPATFPLGGYDYLVFIDVDGWFVRGGNNAKPLPISYNIYKLPLDLLQQQAKVLRTK
jgi:hypothetical protein